MEFTAGIFNKVNYIQYTPTINQMFFIPYKVLNIALLIIHCNSH